MSQHLTTTVIDGYATARRSFGTGPRARRMAAEAPHRRAAVLPNARHMVAFVSPEPFNTRLRAFLEEHKA